MQYSLPTYNKAIKILSSSFTSAPLPLPIDDEECRSSVVCVVVVAPCTAGCASVSVTVVASLHCDNVLIVAAAGTAESPRRQSDICENHNFGANCNEMTEIGLSSTVRHIFPCRKVDPLFISQCRDTVQYVHKV